MSTRPVVVFGGTGFLGRALIAALTRAGHRVRVVSRRVTPAGLPADVESTRADVRQEAAVRSALAGAGAVINAVSLYVERADLGFRAIHVDGAARVARLAHEAGARHLLHVSGIGVDHDSPSAYVRARAAGEVAVRAAFPAATLLRPSVIFGPGDSFLATLDGITRLPVIPLFGLGRTRLQPVHVADVAGAATAILDRDAEPWTLELGGGDAVRYRDLVAAVLRQRGRWRPMLPVPFLAWHAAAAAATALPSPPLTRDQVHLMGRDNVADPAMPGFGALAMEARGILASLPACLPADPRRA